MYDVRYINSLNEELELSNAEIRIIEAPIHEYSWEYEAINRQLGCKVTGFKKQPLIFEISFLVNDYIKANLNEMLEYAEVDILNKKLGKLYFNNTYIECYIIKSTTKPFDDGYGTERTWTVLAPYPFWIREKYEEFFSGTNNASNGGLDYKMGYKYDYTENARGVAVWEREHFAESHFKLIIYGAVSSPRIAIGNNIYEVDYDIASGEVMVIDSKEKEVYKIAVNGERKNLFAHRNRDFDIFKKLEPNTLHINWSGSFGFNLTIFEERSEPKWSSS